MKNKKHTIDPNAVYSMTDIARLGLFPWCANIATVRRWVLKDMKGEKKLKTLAQFRGRGRKYHIFGRNIIAFVESVEAGKYPAKA